MFELNINGKIVYSETDKPLLSFLRDDLKITSAKDGCSGGTCGTCIVLVNGKAVKGVLWQRKKAERPAKKACTPEEMR